MDLQDGLASTHLKPECNAPARAVIHDYRAAGSTSGNDLRAADSMHGRVAVAMKTGDGAKDSVKLDCSLVVLSNPPFFAFCRWTRMTRPLGIDGNSRDEPVVNLSPCTLSPASASSMNA
ncbi:hypothetical protein GGQ88_001254 [Novosphingobium hassiacum]|uniref:Uncharacterized protein n=1 Tax=Novosphingobium hassiacum TaxID=173676 RepID=A0A7W5ZVV0_9SPHN|nr:hypothetical protein [Novosphingobium hassiacum]MBB3859993.1 hypothetical protein [Novosphingobium hassiacum]